MPSPDRARFQNTRDQREALRELVLFTRSTIFSPEAAPLVVTAARKITQGCPARDDRCELEAIYKAVKHGTPAVKALSKGLRYVSDPVIVDWFQSGERTLKSCAKGACAGDCDEHAVLVAQLCIAVGFEVGLRAWAPPKGSRDYGHIYACAAASKSHPSNDPLEWLGMDTTVDSARVGWDPPAGRWITAVVTE